jgi:hypothetical protein
MAAAVVPGVEPVHTPVSPLSREHTYLFPGAIRPHSRLRIIPSQVFVYGRRPDACGACEHGTPSLLWEKTRLSSPNASPTGRVQEQRAQTMLRCS